MAATSPAPQPLLFLTLMERDFFDSLGFDASDLLCGIRLCHLEGGPPPGLRNVSQERRGLCN